MSVGHIFLVGFMGSGKSTLARMLASQRGLEHVDLDAEIEQAAGRTIAEIFERDGEEAFRELESRALLELEGRPPSVVACGGGVVLRSVNRAALKRLGRVVHLDVSALEAIARVGDGSTRPLLSGAAGPLAATALLAAREGLYRSVADVSVDTSGRAPEEVAEAVLVALGDAR
jgi:shikimate kinase